MLWVLCVMPLCGAQGGTAEEIPAAIDGIFARYVQLGKDVGEVLGKVHDKQSAAETVAALRALLPRVGDARREIGGIDKLQPDVAKAVSAKYERAMREAWGKAFDGIYRLQREKCYEEVTFFRAFSILCSLLDS